MIYDYVLWISGQFLYVVVSCTLHGDMFNQDNMRNACLHTFLKHSFR